MPVEARTSVIDTGVAVLSPEVWISWNGRAPSFFLLTPPFFHLSVPRPHSLSNKIHFGRMSNLSQAATQQAAQNPSQLSPTQTAADRSSVLPCPCLPTLRNFFDYANKPTKLESSSVYSPPAPWCKRLKHHVSQTHHYLVLNLLVSLGPLAPVDGAWDQVMKSSIDDSHQFT